MGQFKVGPKSIEQAITKTLAIPGSLHIALHNRIADLEHELLTEKLKPAVEIIKEVPVEVKVIEEKIIEKPIYIEREVIKEFPVMVEKIVEVIKEVPKEIKVIEEKFIDRPFEVIKEITKEVNKIPLFIYGIIGIESLVILFLMFK